MKYTITLVELSELVINTARIASLKTATSGGRDEMSREFGIGNRDAGILYCVKRGYKILINVASAMQNEDKKPECLMAEEWRHITAWI